MSSLNASVRAAVLSLLLSAPAAASPASDLFSQVSGLILRNYGGLSAADRPALLTRAQGELDSACAEQADSCPTSAAYGVLKRVVAGLSDVHSYLNTPTEEAEYQRLSSGSARLQFGFTSAPLPDGSRVVTEVLDGTPAFLAGLTRGDHLLSLDGHPYDQAELSRLREAGAQVTLGFSRAGQAMSVTLQARETSSRNLPRLSWVGATAVIRIPTFISGGGIAQRVHDLVRVARDRAAQGLVIDLRDNPGGSLFECDLAVTPFVDGVERSLAGTDGTRRMSAQAGSWRIDGVEAARVNTPQRWDGPLAVLVNARSASCSEFFALAVQGARRGLVIGEPTSGAGNTSTTAYPLPDGGALHLTRSHFAYPDGRPYPDHVDPDQGARDDLQELAQGDDRLLSLGVAAVQATQTSAHTAP